MPAPTTTRSLLTGGLSTLTTLPSAGAPPPHPRPLLRDGRGSAAGSWSSPPVVTQALSAPKPSRQSPSPPGGFARPCRLGLGTTTGKPADARGGHSKPEPWAWRSPAGCLTNCLTMILPRTPGRTFPHDRRAWTAVGSVTGPGSHGRGRDQALSTASAAPRSSDRPLDRAAA